MLARVYMDCIIIIFNDFSDVAKQKFSKRTKQSSVGKGFPGNWLGVLLEGNYDCGHHNVLLRKKNEKVYLSEQAGLTGPGHGGAGL